MNARQATGAGAVIQMAGGLSVVVVDHPGDVLLRIGHTPHDFIEFARPDGVRSVWLRAQSIVAIEEV